MSTMTSEREAFEKVARERDYNLHHDSGGYEDELTQDAWRIWQAARPHLAQPAQAVDVGAVEQCIDALRRPPSVRPSMDVLADKLTRALSGEKAGPVDVQFWLAEMDRYGNPKLCDGAHSYRDGAEEAATIIRQLGLAHDRRFAVAEVRLSELTGEHAPVNQDAIKTLKAIGLRPASPTPGKEGQP